MARRVSTELIDRQGSELQRIEYTPGRSAELAEELDVINGEMLEMAKMREFNDDPGAFDRILRSRVERRETGS